MDNKLLRDARLTCEMKTSRSVWIGPFIGESEVTTRANKFFECVSKALLVFKVCALTGGSKDLGTDHGQGQLQDVPTLTCEMC